MPKVHTYYWNSAYHYIALCKSWLSMVSVHKRILQHKPPINGKQKISVPFDLIYGEPYTVI